MDNSTYCRLDRRGLRKSNLHNAKSVYLIPQMNSKLEATSLVCFCQPEKLEGSFKIVSVCTQRLQVEFRE